jgi:hypothetical protein
MTAHAAPIGTRGTPPAPTAGLAAPGAPHPDGNGDEKAASAPAQPAKDPRLAAEERRFIAQLFEQPGPKASQEERLAWEQSPVADLLYPPEHACAGQPLDSTSPATLIQAGEEALGKQLDQVPDIDVPQCVYQGNWPFQALNAACSGVNRDVPADVARCTEYLMTGFQDQAAYPATVWLPCSPNGAQPTTRRQFFENMIAEQVQHMFSGPPCTVH